MKDGLHAEDRWSFVDRIQAWFQCKNQFWLSLSIFSLGAILALQAVSIFASQENPAAWQQSEFLIIPLLGIFVLSIFWRSIVHCVLAFTGATVTYAGVFLFHTPIFVSQLEAPSIADRLGYGIKHTAHVSPDALANWYFAVGIFALLFCLAIAIRPSFFRAKNYDGISTAS